MLGRKNRRGGSICICIDCVGVDARLHSPQIAVRTALGERGLVYPFCFSFLLSCRRMKFCRMRKEEIPTVGLETSVRKARSMKNSSTMFSFSLSSSFLFHYSLLMSIHMGQIPLLLDR